MTPYTLKHISTGTLAGFVIDGACSLEELSDDQIVLLIDALDDFENKVTQYLRNQVYDSLEAPHEDQ